MTHEVKQGDCLEVLKGMADCSIDSLVTDPPAGIGFMGKDWDKDKGGRTAWVSWLTEIMTEAHRVLKPGAHGLVWALPRTSHWTAWALEEAGFELRDCIYHVFGSGFPKSADISKQLDKMAGAEREVVGAYNHPDGRKRPNSLRSTGGVYGEHGGPLETPITAPATPAAQQWQGWGTALKPAVECWWLIRKPISERNIAANVVRWGTGGINVDGCRVGTDAIKVNGWKCGGEQVYNGRQSEGFVGGTHAGRFPAHLIHDGSPEVLAGFPVTTTNGQGNKRIKNSELMGKNGIYNKGWGDKEPDNKYANDSGSAARFFYCAKPSQRERNRGLEGFDDKDKDDHNLSSNACGRCGLRIKANGSGKKCECGDLRETVKLPPPKNHHPTVKPVTLMRYLCRLITPPGGTLIDLFTGSGTTGIAAKMEGFNFLGIEREAEYCDIARARIDAWEPDSQLTIFDNGNQV